MKYKILFITIIFVGGILYMTRNINIAVADKPTPPVIVTTLLESQSSSYCYKITDSSKTKNMLPFIEINCTK